MFLLLNGAFGIGKTTTARALVCALPGAAISDPELIGYVLRRLPAPMLGLSEMPADYQDMALWRRLIVKQARLAKWWAEIVVVPMAFTNKDYLAAFEGALRETAPVTKVCLVAPLALVRKRLAQRAAAEGRGGLTEFELRRSAECVAAHRDMVFGEKVDARMTTNEIVEAIRAIARR